MSAEPAHKRPRVVDPLKLRENLRKLTPVLTRSVTISAEVEELNGHLTRSWWLKHMAAQLVRVPEKLDDDSAFLLTANLKDANHSIRACIRVNPALWTADDIYCSGQERAPAPLETWVLSTLREYAEDDPERMHHLEWAKNSWFDATEHFFERAYEAIRRVRQHLPVLREAAGAHADTFDEKAHDDTSETDLFAFSAAEWTPTYERYLTVHAEHKRLVDEAALACKLSDLANHKYTQWKRHMEEKKKEAATQQ